jgi:hypothetical protein
VTIQETRRPTVAFRPVRIARPDAHLLVPSLFSTAERHVDVALSGSALQQLAHIQLVWGTVLRYKSCASS